MTFVQLFIDVLKCMYTRDAKNALVCISIIFVCVQSAMINSTVYITGSYLAYIDNHWYIHVFCVICMHAAYFTNRFIQITIFKLEALERQGPAMATGQNDNDWEYQWIQTADEYWYKTLHWKMMTWRMCLDMFRTILRKSEARVAHPETSTVKKWQRCDLCMRRWTRVFEGDSRTFFIICEVNMSSWQLRTTSNPLCGVTNNILAVGR